MAAKFFTGLPLDGPDPECVRGQGVGTAGPRPVATVDHTRRRPVFVPLPDIPLRPCHESPLA